jgi:hypothetical protein
MVFVAARAILNSRAANLPDTWPAYLTHLDRMVGELFTQWTIRLALALYVAWLAGWLCARGPKWLGVARWLWTAGCGLLFLHVACAFHFSHGWSHSAAWMRRGSSALLISPGAIFSRLTMRCTQPSWSRTLRIACHC